MNKKIASELAIGIILFTAIIVGFSFWTADKKENRRIQEMVKPAIINESAEKKATLLEQDNGQQPIEEPEKISAFDENEYRNNIYKKLPSDLILKEYNDKIIPKENHIILTSILSHDKEKVVYYERSIENFDYNIVVLDIKTGLKKVIYFFQSGISPSSGAGPFEYFPVAWSTNDKKIILEWSNTTGSGSGGVPQYKTYTISMSGGELTGLATEGAFFLDNYSKVVYLNESTKSPRFCGPGAYRNNGSILLKNIESNEEKIIAEEENTEYSLIKIDKSILTYKAQRVRSNNSIKTNGCSELDESFPIEEKKVEIK